MAREAFADGQRVATAKLPSWRTLLVETWGDHPMLLERSVRPIAAKALACGAALFALPTLMTAPAHAGTVAVGSIYACYACQNTGDQAIDDALAANPSVANDGLLFEFNNTSGTAITGGVFHL